MKHHWRDTANLPRTVLDEIASAIDQAMPREAVGLVWESPGSPVGHLRLRNISDAPESSYTVSVADVITGFEAVSGLNIVEAIHEGTIITLWHSHPSGLVGPSRGDMREKVSEGLTYMVIAVTHGDEDGPTLTATLF